MTRVDVEEVSSEPDVGLCDTKNEPDVVLILEDVPRAGWVVLANVADPLRRKAYSDVLCERTPGPTDFRGIRGKLLVVVLEGK